MPASSRHPTAAAGGRSFYPGVKFYQFSVILALFLSQTSPNFAITAIYPSKRYQPPINFLKLQLRLTSNEQTPTKNKEQHFFKKHIRKEKKTHQKRKKNKFQKKKIKISHKIKSHGLATLVRKFKKIRHRLKRHRREQKKSY